MKAGLANILCTTAGSALLGAIVALALAAKEENEPKLRKADPVLKQTGEGAMLLGAAGLLTSTSGQVLKFLWKR